MLLKYPKKKTCMMICMYRTQRAIQKIADSDNSIESKILLMLEYISSVSHYSYRNRCFATQYFMEWILKQNVKSVYLDDISRQARKI